MRVHIESKGDSHTTLVTDSETGSIIPMIQKVTWEVSSDNDFANCKLEIALPTINVDADVTSVQALPIQYVGKIENMSKDELIIALKQEAGLRYLAERELNKLKNV